MTTSVITTERRASFYSAQYETFPLDAARDVHARDGRAAQQRRRDEEGEGAVACHPQRFGDVVLARKDAPASCFSGR